MTTSLNKKQEKILEASKYGKEEELSSLLERKSSNVNFKDAVSIRLVLNKLRII